MMASAQVTADEIIKTKTFEDLDYFGDLVIRSDGQDRIKLWNHFETLFELYEHKDAQFGRIYNRRKICQLAMRVTVAMLLDKGVEVGPVLGDIPKSPISKWSKGDWDGFKDLLLSTVNDLLRQDSNRSVSDGEDEEPNEERNEAGAFKNRLDTLLKTILVFRGVTPLQETFNTVLSPDCTIGDDDTVPVDKEIMKKFQKTILQEKNELVKAVLQGICQKEDPDGNVELINVKRLRSQLEAKPLCFDHFYKRMNRTMHNWMEVTFVIAAVDEESHHAPVPSPSALMIHRLRASRASLDARVEDPLDESYAIASRAVRYSKRRTRSRSPASSHHSPTPRKRQRGTLLAKKRSARSIEFDDIEASDDSVENRAANGSTHGLSDMPARRRNSIGRKSPVKQSQVKQYAGRRKWSEEEDTAIKEGLRSGMIGRWADIKTSYLVILFDRTSGQIKDRVRTMKKKKMLDDILMEIGEMTK